MPLLFLQRLIVKPSSKSSLLTHSCGMRSFDREGRNKIGVLPVELFKIIDSINSEHLKINLDIEDKCKKFDP